MIRLLSLILCVFFLSILPARAELSEVEQQELYEEGYMLLMSVGGGLTEEDRARGFKILLGLAEDGHMMAEWRVGVAFLMGRGVEQDQTKSLYWMEKAADQGYMFAQAEVGKAYALGEGVERNDEKAFNYLEGAAKQGHPTGMAGLSAYYYYGQYVKEDRKKADYYTSEIRKFLSDEQRSSAFTDKLVGFFFYSNEPAQFSRKLGETLVCIGNSEAQFLFHRYSLRARKNDDAKELLRTSLLNGNSAAIFANGLYWTEKQSLAAFSPKMAYAQLMVKADEVLERKKLDLSDRFSESQIKEHIKILRRQLEGMLSNDELQEARELAEDMEFKDVHIPEKFCEMISRN